MQKRRSRCRSWTGNSIKVLYHASNSRILEHVLSDFHKYVKMAQDHVRGGGDPGGEVYRGAPRYPGRHPESRDEDLAERLANEHVMKVMKNLHIEEEKR